MKIFKLIKYQMKAQRYFYIIFFIVLNVFVFYFYLYGDRIAPENNLNVNGFFVGVSLSYMLATSALSTFHIIMYFQLLSSGKRYLIFGSPDASASNVYFARLINFILDLVFTKAYLLLLLFAMSIADEKLCGKYWLWILYFNKYLNIKANYGIVLIDLSIVSMLSLWMHLGMVFRCWNNRHRYNIVDTVMDILAVCLIIISGFASSGSINVIQRVIHFTPLLNVTVIAFTLIVIILFAKSSISRMKTKMDL